ncbi:DUF1045 domain-containing protein [Aestuariibius insulae]|uniref:DUF1045 domain-containing protein n=1 Tax=Aestuariibius insulae TaxID=2058287 RepID=UPI00345E51A6
MFARYTIFYTPPPGDLFEFAARWLGWDSRAGRAMDHLDLDGIDVAGVTATPRKYGFHGTVKAPFRMVDGQNRAALEAALEGFARDRAAVVLDGLELSVDHGFLALRPKTESRELAALAADVVRQFDPFRAPLTDGDIARRRKAGLSPRQDKQMLDWGYPYIFDDFNFHLTLSGRLAPSECADLLRRVEPLIAPHLAKPYRIGALAVMGEASEDGLFHELSRVELTG